MKLAALFVLLSVLPVFAQTAAPDFSKSPIEYAREGKFREASIVLDTLYTKQDLSYFFIFGISVVVRQAYDGDTTCMRLLQFNGAGDYRLSRFCKVMYEICAFKQGEYRWYRPANYPEFLAVALENVVSDPNADLLDLYAVFFGWREMDARLSVSLNELVNKLETRLNTIRMRGNDPIEEALLRAMRFELQYYHWCYHDRFPTETLTMRFPYGSRSLLESVPLMKGSVRIFEEVFTAKMLVLSHNAWLTGVEKQKYAVEAFIEDPSKKHLRKVKRLFRKDDDYRALIGQVFDSLQKPAPFGDSTLTFVRSHAQTGKWMIVDVWGTWCEPCIAELPEWQKLYTDKHTDIAFVALSAFSANAQEFLDQREYTFPNHVLSKTEIDALGLTYYPATFLISPGGKAVVLSHENKMEQIQVLTGCF